jgi:hypothetical protein
LAADYPTATSNTSKAAMTAHTKQIANQNAQVWAARQNHPAQTYGHAHGDRNARGHLAGRARRLPSRTTPA